MKILRQKLIDIHRESRQEMASAAEAGMNIPSTTLHERKLCNDMLKFAKENKVLVLKVDYGNYFCGGGKISRKDDPKDWYSTKKKEKDVCMDAFSKGYDAVITWTNSSYVTLAHELGHFLSWQKKKDNRGIIGFLGNKINGLKKSEWNNPNILTISKGYITCKQIYNNESNADRYGEEILRSIGATDKDIEKYWKYSSSEHFYKPQVKSVLSGLTGKVLYGEKKKK